MCQIAGMFSLKEISLRDKLIVQSFQDFDDVYFANGNNFLMGANKIIAYKDYYIGLYGNIINSQEVIDYLKNEGISADNENYLYYLFTLNCIDRLEGGFVLVFVNENKVYVYRDQLGINSLFYTLRDDILCFSSSLDFLVRLLNINEVNKEGILELMGMGPSHSLRKTVYKDVYRLDGGEYIAFDGVLTKKYYYEFDDEIIDDDYNTVLRKTKELILDSYKKYQGGKACLLSGGLDSSIVLSLLGQNINTYTIKYDNNDFKGDDFLLSNDLDYVSYMVDEYNSNEHYINIGIDDLINGLEDACILRGYPAMADIDSSLLILLSKIDDEVIYSGECSDEVFSGYPWCKEKALPTTFPWLRNLDIKVGIIKEKYRDLIYDYINNEFENARSSHQNHLVNYLNLKYFLANLLERQERMAIGANKKVYSIFGSYRLANYLLNIKREHFDKPMEKMILRDIFRRDLPDEILSRKKSPYPKLENDLMLERIKSLVLERLKDTDSILHQIIDIEALKNISFDKPWYGQLMKEKELYCYLYQIDFWGREYNIKIVE